MTLINNADSVLLAMDKINMGNNLILIYKERASPGA